MRKGQKLSMATNRARYNHQVKMMRQEEKRARKRIRQDYKPRSSSNKYTHSPDIYEEIWEFVYMIIKKFFQKIFR